MSLHFDSFLAQGWLRVGERTVYGFWVLVEAGYVRGPNPERREGRDNRTSETLIPKALQLVETSLEALYKPKNTRVEGLRD